MLEEFECVQTQLLSECLTYSFHEFTLWQGHAVSKQNHTQNARHEELEVSELELGEVFANGEAKVSIMPSGAVHKPHSGDETYGAKHTNRWEVFHCVHSVVFKNGKRSGVRQRKRRHIKRHAEGVGGNKHCLVGGVGSLSHHKQGNHACTSQKVANTEQTLWLNPLISHNTHQGWHENRHYTLNCIEPRNFGTHTRFSEVVAHTCEICSPYSKLQEVHHN